MRYIPLLLAFIVSSAHAASLNDVARDYVHLVLALGEHDSGYVDAYYGPPQWRDDAKEAALGLEEIVSRADQLSTQLPGDAQNDPARALRIAYLRGQLSALRAYAQQLHAPGQRNFDAEASALYDTVPPRTDYQEYDAILEQLDALLPGDSPLHQRVDAFFSSYEIPKDKLEAVFGAAIEACKQRTAEYIALPSGENFQLEYVTDKPWSGYNWYQGKSQSLIQINVTLPVRIDRAIDLGCHEGYPGHHTYNALLESELVDQRGWVEFSVYPLFSPQSLIAEGTANYGIELAFPGDEKLAFERRVLYPLAGLDPATADRYDEVAQLTTQLSFARNETARRYINGEISREQAIELAQRYGPTSRERAEQSVRFIDTYGAYVINYNWGKKLVADYIERDTKTAPERWQKFRQLLASPRLPSGLGG
jgi:hypothetical protein